MIRLHLLGSLALDRPDGTAVRSILAQPKRFALLAYLAAAHPPATRRRDTLIGLLWPELDEEHARMNLRQSLYRLRQALGPGVLTGKGSERVGVDPGRLWCDAARLERALEEGRPEEALDLYRGPLLQGFHLSGAREFERWLQGERRRLRLRVVDATRTLVERAEEGGDRSAARRWAERALRIAPYDEAAFRRYLEVLGGQGDRATAVRAYESFAARLADDLELEPSAETAALMEEIRRGRSASDGRASSGEVGSGRSSAEASHAPIPETAGRSSAPDARGSVPSPRPGSAGRPGPERPRPKHVAYAAVVLLVAVLGYVGLVRPEPPGSAAEARSGIRSLAVLPLDDLSGAAGPSYFADGMTEALIAELGRLEELAVISRTSAMHYRDTDRLVPEIGRELGVDALIEGSVQRAGGEVRITLQLIHAPTDRHLWSESYEGRLADVLDLQRRVARSVAEEIRLSLGPGERERLAAPAPSPDPRAYEAYLKGRYQAERLGEESLRKALSHLREAVALDPSFAPAHAALAEACSMPALLGVVTTVSECGASARRAVELDDDLAEAHAALGLAEMLAWEWEASERAFRRALELNPSSVMARQWYAELLRRTTRHDEALVQIRRAERLDPLNLLVKTMVGWPLFSQRRYGEALAQWDEVLAMDPDYGLALYNRGLAHWMLGRPGEVLEAARSAARRLGEDAPVVLALRAAGHALAGDRERALAALARSEASPGRDRPGLMAAVYLALGREEEALDRLEAGYERRDPWLPNTTTEPLLDGLRDEPRFRRLLAGMGQAPDDAVLRPRR